MSTKNYNKMQDLWDNALPPFTEEVEEQAQLDVSAYGNAQNIAKLEKFLEIIADKYDLDIRL